MPNSVDIGVYTHVDARQLAATSNEIQRKFHDLAGITGRDFGREFSRQAQLDPKLPSSAKFAAEGRVAGQAWGRGFSSGADRGLTSFNDASQAAAKNMQNLSTAATGAGSSIASSLNPVGIAAGAAALMAAATVGIGALGMLGGAAAELSGALGLLPGVLTLVAAGMGTAKIATFGFFEAISDVRDPKKFAEALQQLSPSAQQAALSIQAMLPAIDQLKNAAQNALFDGVGKQLNELARTYLPSIQAMVTSIATSFNGMFKAIADQLMQPETQTAIQSALNNIGEAFQKLVPAIGPVTGAIADLVNVSSSFLPGMATAVANVAQQFSAWLSEAARTGELRLWLQQGLEALGQIGSLLPTLRDMFSQFKANGQTAMHDLVEATRGVIWIVGELGGAYDRVSGVVKSLANLTVASFNLIGSSISGALQPIREMIKLNNKINPLFNLPELGEFTPSALPAPGAGINPFNPGIPGRAVPELNSGPPATPGLGSVAGTPLVPSAVPPYPNQPYAVPAVPATGSSTAAKLPTVPLGNNDPMSLLQGFQPTAALYGAAGTVLDDRQKVAQLQSDVNKLESANVRDEDAITKKKNDLAIAQREEHEAELRLAEAKQQANDKSLKSMQQTHGAMQQIGAGLDKDLGLSKGLPGLADNLVRFLASLATAPLQGQLAKMADQGDGSYGLFGMMFGGPNPNRTNSLGQQQVSYPGQPGYSDAALLANVPAGRYSQTGIADLTKGLGDCSSAVEDLVNLMDGRPTAGRSMSTGNEAQWLTSRGFVPGMGGPGDFRVGFNSGHTQATLPGGTNFNWGSDAAAAARGLDGSLGAYDPAFTDHYYRPATSAPPIAQTPIAGPTGLSLPGQPPSSGPGAFAAPSLPGGPLSSGFPNGMPAGPSLGLVSPDYSAQATPQAQGGWQPNGGGGLGMGGGLMGAAMSAGSMALNGLAPGAGAAAQTAMQLINRTIKFGGQAAGIAAEGLIDTFTPTNPDTGKNPLEDSWLWRVAGALAGAAPALGSGGAGDQDKAAQKRQQEQMQALQGQQGQQSPQQSGPLVHIENLNQGSNQSGKSLGQDIAGQLQQQVQLPR